METNTYPLIAPGLIDSRLKLRLMLLLVEEHEIDMLAGNLSLRLFETHWSIETAIEGLCHARLIRTADEHGTRTYCLNLEPDTYYQLTHLAADYDDPQQRDSIYGMIGAAQRERQYVEALERHDQLLERTVGYQYRFEGLIV